MKTRLPQIVVWLASASLLVVACYNPNIAQGGFQCGAKNACPQNFHCASDNRCYRGDAGPTDAGVACESPPPTPSCSIDAGSDQTCNPGCQRGCACGWCAISGNNTVSCSTAKQGKTALGQVCDPTATTNPCKPGLFCQPECGSVGRCLQVCNANHECNTTDAGTSTCSLTASGTTFRLCTLPNCDPFKDTGCPTGSACYAIFPSQTFCSCAGTKAAGATCVNTDDCQPGYTCIGGASGSHCAQLCNNTTNADCASDGGSATCTVEGQFGFCM